MLPPPAPTVCTSTIGSWIGRPAIDCSEASRTGPSSITATSQEVPPMSNDSTSACPERPPACAAPTAPAAGPDNTVHAAWRPASCARHQAAARPHDLGLGQPGRGSARSARRSR